MTDAQVRSCPTAAPCRTAVTATSAAAPAIRRASLWLIAAAMALVIGLKSHASPWPAVPWHVPGWVALAAGVGLAWRSEPNSRWAKTTVLLAWTIVLLFFTRIDGETTNAHVVELALKLGVGVLVVPALAAKWWLKEPLDYRWLNGRWSLRMWVWLPCGFLLAFAFMWLYFYILTPNLHHSWPLPLTGDRSEAMWRLFWGCNFVGIWDELAFINFVFVLLCRSFPFREANLAQAVFFASFLHEMAFVGWGPLVIFAFALVQGLTYRRTGSLLYIVGLHLMVDSVLFYMIANRWYPGWGWHPWGF
jgi:hypothetical protein